MRRLLVAFSVSAFAALSQMASASGWEETFLVLQTDSGALVHLEYASEGKDEQAGIRRYKTYAPAKEASPTQCSYRDIDNPKRLRCTLVEGKHTKRLYEERLRPSVTLAAVASQIYKDFVGNRLPSSVGGLHREVLVCTAGCPEGQKPVAIWITCAECGMEEEWCYRRHESRPKLATIDFADEVNLRAEPALSSKIAAKLQLNQTVRVLEATSACSEIETKEGVRVGRWIKVSADSTPQKAVGWVFDIYVRYDNEK